MSDEAMIALIHAVHFSQGTAGPETKNSSTAGITVSPRNGRVINSQDRPLDISASECSQKKMRERVFQRQIQLLEKLEKKEIQILSGLLKTFLIKK